MRKLKFPVIRLGNLFKRKEYDPTEFQSINQSWDETSSANNTQASVSDSGKFQNPNLPLEEKINQVMQKLELFEKSLPDLKK